jgi:hypothetical protein
MSFFDAFVGGAAQAGAGIIERAMQNDAMLENQKAMAQFSSDLELSRQKALAAIQDQITRDRADAVTQKLGQTASAQADQSYNTNYSADQIAPDDTNADDRGDIQREVNRMQNMQDDQKQQAIAAIQNSPMARAKVENQIGYLSTKDLVGMDQREQGLNLKEYDLENRSKRLDDRANNEAGRLEVMRDANDIKAQLAEIKANGGSKDDAIKYLTQQRTTATQDLNASLHAEDMAQKSIKDHYLVKPEKGGNKNYEQELEQWKQELQEKKDALKRRQEASEDARNTVHDVSNLFKQYTTTPSKPDNGAKSPAPTSSIPSGYTIIGQTPKGQTVYRTPDGKTVVSKG